MVKNTDIYSQQEKSVGADADDFNLTSKGLSHMALVKIVSEINKIKRV